MRYLVKAAHPDDAATRVYLNARLDGIPAAQDGFGRAWKGPRDEAEILRNEARALGWTEVRLVRLKRVTRIGGVQVWRYFLQLERGNWHVVMLDSDGFFSTVGSYGKYGHLWSSTDQGIREFVADLEQDPDYARRKLNPSEKIDDEKTRALWVARIKRLKGVSRYSHIDFKREGQHLSEADFGNEFSFCDWLHSTSLPVHEMVGDGDMYETSPDRQIVAFCERVLPALSRAIRLELAVERGLASAVPAGHAALKRAA